MHFRDVVALAAGLFNVIKGIVLEPIEVVDLLQESIGECISGTIVRDTTFIDNTLTLLNRGTSEGARRTREEILFDWHAIQQNAAKRVQETDESARRILETSSPVVLIAQAVKGTQPTVNRLRRNMEVLKDSSYGKFRWALFLYDDPEEWDKHEWYRTSPDIVRKDRIPEGGCEVEHIRRISVKDMQEYDYVWLMDDDVDVSFMDWELYSTILASAQPLVSQPAILAGSFAGRASDVQGLTMVQASKNGELVVAAERPHSEVMAPIISSKLWPAIQERAMSKVTRCDIDLNIFWDIAAFLGRIYCNISAIAVVNAAPVSHVDCRTMPNVHQCFTNCEPDLGRSISALEASLMQTACKEIPSNWMTRWGCDKKGLGDCLRAVRNDAYSKPREITLRLREDALPQHTAPDVSSPGAPSPIDSSTSGPNPSGPSPGNPSTSVPSSNVPNPSVPSSSGHENNGTRGVIPNPLESSWQPLPVGQPSGDFEQPYGGVMQPHEDYGGFGGHLQPSEGSGQPPEGSGHPSRRQRLDGSRQPSRDAREPFGGFGQPPGGLGRLGGSAQPSAGDWQPTAPVGQPLGVAGQPWAPNSASDSQFPFGGTSESSTGRGDRQNVIYRSQSSGIVSQSSGNMRSNGGGGSQPSGAGSPSSGGRVVSSGSAPSSTRQNVVASPSGSLPQNSTTFAIPRRHQSGAREKLVIGTPKKELTSKGNRTRRHKGRNNRKTRPHK